MFGCSRFLTIADLNDYVNIRFIVSIHVLVFMYVIHIVLFCLFLPNRDM